MARQYNGTSSNINTVRGGHYERVIDTAVQAQLNEANEKRRKVSSDIQKLTLFNGMLSDLVTEMTECSYSLNSSYESAIVGYITDTPEVNAAYEAMKGYSKTLSDSTADYSTLLSDANALLNELEEMQKELDALIGELRGRLYKQVWVKD